MQREAWIEKMAVWDIFSKRQNRLSDVQDVFQYDEIPHKLRVQVILIFDELLGKNLDYHPVAAVYKSIVEKLRREYGCFLLPPTTSSYTGYIRELDQFLLTTNSVNECLDVIELGFDFIDKVVRQNRHVLPSDGIGARAATNAINELNTRFKENGVGYQFVDGQIIRVDSQLLHAEAVRPALTLLNTREYHGPHEEFISAYDHYKNGKNKEALNDCLKAFESTMKAICDKRRWAYDPKTATAKTLIDIMFAKGLVPTFWQQEFASLRSLLESSVPTGRNKLAGHGQGSTPTEVPDYITAYMLHMTASTLVFLTTAEKAVPKLPGSGA